MWEYIFIEETNSNKLIQQLSQYGAQNWEVCGYTLMAGAMGRGHHFVILKRPRQ